MLKIYHNARCSKSRQTLALIEDAGAEVEVVEYLLETPSAEELKELLQKLGLKAVDIIRKGEPVYKEKFAGKTRTNAQWLKILVNNPKLIERPIVVKGDQAVLGRPPENVLTLLNN